MANYSIKSSVIINASPSRIWETLTDPDKIVLYTGSRTTTDWGIFSTITWEGEISGNRYVNKGMVLDKIPNKFLKFSFWTGMGGDPDVPENYSEVTYEMDILNEYSTELNYIREKIPTEIEKQVFESHLPGMLAEIKRITEESE